MTPASTNGTILPDRYSIPLLFALIAAGLAGNYSKFPIFLNIDFLFGSVFAMLALQFFGFGRGVLAAAIIASYTYILWNHPYAIIIMTAEAATVGWLIGRRKMGMLLADTLYWLIIGMPLVCLFYHLVMHVPLGNVYIVMTKQAINGMANALLARLLFTAYTLRSRRVLMSYREVVCNMLALFVLCPAMIMIAIESRSDFNETDRKIRAALIEESGSLDLRLETWVLNRKSAIINLANMAASKSPQQMQPYLEHAKKSDVNFLRVGLLDKDATVTAYFPLSDELGRGIIGKNYADRPFIPILKQRLTPMLSEVVMGKVGVARPIVLLIAPVIMHGEYGGYVAGTLDMGQIREHLDRSSAQNTMLYTLLDKNGNVIMTNRNDQQVMAPFVRGTGTLDRVDRHISQWVPAVPPNTPISERWTKSYYIAETVIGDLAEWRLVLEQPVAPFQKALYGHYTAKLTLLFLILLGALALAEFISRRIVVTLGQLRALTHELPARLGNGDKAIVWPESGFAEANDLINNFRETADTLSEKFIEIRQINESLERRVEERTRELKISRDQWERTFNSIPDYITIIDIHHNILHANQAMLDLFSTGCTGFLPDQPCYRIVHGLDAPPDYCPHSMLLCDGAEHREELFEPLLGKYLLVTATPIHGGDGEVIGSIHVARDITARKQLENDLQKTNEYNRSLIECSLDPLVTIGSDGRITDVNQATVLVTGFSREELIGSDFSSYIADAERARAGYQQAFREGTVRDYPLEIRHRNGALTPVLYNATVYHDSNNNVVGIFAAARDISELKKAQEEKQALEQQLQQAQKMESLGVLAGGIAHDFNNILAVIMCYASLGQQKPEQAAELMPEIEKASGRAAELCRQMLAYAGKTQFIESTVDVTVLVDDMLGMLKSTLPQNVTIKPYLTGGIPPIKADAGQIRQLVMNLIINASEAIGDEEGHIRVALTKTTILKEQEQNDHLGKAIKPGQYICLEVSDTGCGMDDETMQRIFEPFYTTKFVGRGLGMSAVLGIITSHKGALQLQSRPGQGSTFQVYLPVQNAESPEKQPEHTTPEQWQGNGTILLVEDEPQLTAVAKALLKTLGFSVIEASDGIEALDTYRKRSTEISVVVTDIGMPRMNGYELIVELRKLDRELPIIVSSGFGDADVTSKIAPGEIAGLVSKPYSFEQLREVLKDVVEGCGRSPSSNGSKY